MLLKLKDTQGNDYLLNKYTIGVVKNHSPGILNIQYMLGNKIEYLTVNMIMEDFADLVDDGVFPKDVLEKSSDTLTPEQFSESEIAAYIADHAPLSPAVLLADKLDCPTNKELWLSGTEFAASLGINKSNLPRWRENGKVNWKKDDVTGYYLYKQLGDTECL